MTDKATPHETHVCQDCGAEITLPYARQPAPSEMSVTGTGEWRSKDTHESTIRVSQPAPSEGLTRDIHALIDEIADSIEATIGQPVHPDARQKWHDRIAAARQPAPSEGLREWLDKLAATPWSEGFSDDFKRGYDTALEEVWTHLDLRAALDTPRETSESV